MLYRVSLQFDSILHLFFIFIDYHTYKQTENNCGCGVAAVGDSDKDYYHARCLCKDVSEKDQCQKLCSDDKHCKGFAMKSEADSASCQLATSQNKCPAGCTHSVESAPTDDNTGALNPEIECHDEGVWMGGCFIKQGILSDSFDTLCDINPLFMSFINV